MKKKILHIIGYILFAIVYLPFMLILFGGGLILLKTPMGIFIILGVGGIILLAFYLMTL